MRCLLATVWSPVCQVRTPLTPVSRDLVGVDEMRDLFDLFVCFFFKKKKFWGLVVAPYRASRCRVA